MNVFAYTMFFLFQNNPYEIISWVKPSILFKFQKSFKMEFLQIMGLEGKKTLPDLLHHDRSFGLLRLFKPKGF